MTQAQVVSNITKIGLSPEKAFCVADLIDRIVYDELIAFKKWHSDFGEKRFTDEHEKEMVEAYLKQKEEQK